MRKSTTAYEKATEAETRAHREAQAAWKAAEVAAFKVTGETGPEKDAIQAHADTCWQNLQDARENLRAARQAFLAS